MKYERQKAFTLIEVVIALFLVIMGIASAFTLIQQVISFASISSSKLTAAYLCQEGIEIVRNIRDTNWLEGGTNPWDEGLTGCSTGCIVDYNHSYGPNQLDPNLPAYANQYLNIDDSGFYSYSAGTPTPFKRRITIGRLDSNANTLAVSVQVQWEERGRTHIVTARENLYNW